MIDGFIVLIFVSLGIFVYGMGLSWVAKTDRQHNIAFMTTMFGFVSLIALELIYVFGGMK